MPISLHTGWACVAPPSINLYCHQFPRPPQTIVPCSCICISIIKYLFNSTLLSSSSDSPLDQTIAYFYFADQVSDKMSHYSNPLLQAFYYAHRAMCCWEVSRHEQNSHRLLATCAHFIGRKAEDETTLSVSFSNFHVWTRWLVFNTGTLPQLLH